MVNKIGLALSGGGFRASLYHLGLVRFLRDAGVLPSVTHITAVSGGSIIAAHLVLNWDRYNSSPGEFDAAASELLSFVRMDVRNRILRRYPLAFPLRWPRRLLGRSNRKLTRTGLLEWHYEKYLYGDTSLFELPEKPQLHILATNLSEGCLSSFNRNGLMMVRRQPGTTFRIDRIHVGLATVPMAVTASSAFPGFFPPLELTGADVGATAGEFGRQAYTDGGVFDNLGVRMFRWLERPLLADSPLSQDDFFDFQAIVDALRKASKSNKETPLRRLTQIMVAACSRPDLLLLANGSSSIGESVPQIAGPGMGGNPPHSTHSHGAGDGNPEAAVLSVLGDLLRHYQFHREPLFSALKPLDPDAEALLGASRPGGRNLDAGDQLWLNRHLLEAAFRQAMGKPGFRRLNSGLDGVLVSDVGKAIEVQANRRAGGLIRTSLRSTDILMDRVWQLEMETFQGTPGFVFVPMTEVVEPAEDPTALHPEIQRQVARIRTDLDRFSLLEISSIVRHGYCVGRKACRAHPDLFGAEVPNNAPWDPIPGHHDTAREVSAATRPARSLLSPLLRIGAEERGEPAAATVEARTLQASALRRIWITLWDFRDWASYVYVPIIVPILFLLPVLTYRLYHRTHQINVLMKSLSSSSDDMEQMSRLIDGPIAPWTGETPEEVRTLDQPDWTGFEVLQDMRILDLRNWDPSASGKSDSKSLIYGYRRLKVFKTPDKVGNNNFRIHLLTTSPLTQVRFPAQQVPAKVRMCNVESSVPGQKECRWEASYDLTNVPAGEFVDLIFEELSPGLFLRRGETSTSLAAEIHSDTAEVTRWILLPKGKEYRNFRVVRYKTDKPDTVEPVRVVTEFLAEDYTILAYKLLSVKSGYTYEVTWFYK
jgi:predicted acylesterase/phospholipase RssA